MQAAANEGPQPWTADQIARIGNAERLWKEAYYSRGTLAEKYLRETRKLDLPEDLAGEVLRFHPYCPWRDESRGNTIYVPALIAAFRSIDDDSVTAVHRVAINADGTKRGRRMLGVVQRAAIKIDQPTDALAIGEGIETCMAARQLGLGPTWALGSVGAISAFPLIDGVRELLLLGEAGDASARALEICGARWRSAGRRVRIVMPDTGYSDLNDVLIAERSA